MATLEEIEEAIRQLPPEKLQAFRAWFVDFDAQLWDREIEEDAAAGRLDQFAEEALRDRDQGRCTEL